MRMPKFQRKRTGKATKSKGAGFEREVCTALSLWWSEGERDDIFWRSNASGARATQRRKVGKDTAYQGGDTTFSDPIGEPLIRHWSIECKTGLGKREVVKDKKGKVVKVVNHTWDILDLIDSQQNTTVFEKIWRQCSGDAETTGRVPVLIFRRNARKKCICFEKTYISTMILYFNVKPKNINTITVFTSRGDAVEIMLLEDFFRWIPDIKPMLTSVSAEISKRR